jgi:hypothetical protein
MALPDTAAFLIFQVDNQLGTGPDLPASTLCVTRPTSLWANTTLPAASGLQSETRQMDGVGSYSFAYTYNLAGELQRSYIYAGTPPLATQEGTGSQVRWEHRDMTNVSVYRTYTDSSASAGEYARFGVPAPCELRSKVQGFSS